MYSLLAVLILTGLFWAGGLGQVQAASPAVVRGQYLVEVIGACGLCHTPRDSDGKEIPGQHLAGGVVANEAFGLVISRNLTPDKETGLGTWTDQDIIRAIREGKRPDGRTLGPPMSYPVYREISDQDAQAIAAYLRQLPP